MAVASWCASMVPRGVAIVLAWIGDQAEQSNPGMKQTRQKLEYSPRVQ